MVNRYIECQREPTGVDHTYGKLTFEGLKFDTIEDEYRAVKVPGETRIPEGLYEIILRKEGGMHRRALSDPRFMGFHRGMLWLQNVPNFEYIYIHWGATDDHTDGCLIVGDGRGTYNGQPAVFHSSRAYEQLYRKALIALSIGDKLFILIKDSPHEIKEDV